MPKQELDLCLTCSIIRGKILLINKWFDNNQFLVKCLQYQEHEQKWIGFSLNYIRKLANDIVDSLNKIETAVALIEKPDSHYRQLLRSEFSFFTKQWHQSIQPNLNKITKDHSNLITNSQTDHTSGTYDLNALKKLEISMIDNEKLIKQIEEHIREPRSQVLQIEDCTRNALINVRSGRRRLARTKAMQNSINKFRICLIVCGFIIFVIFVIILLSFVF